MAQPTFTLVKRKPYQRPNDSNQVSNLSIQRKKKPRQENSTGTNQETPIPLHNKYEPLSEDEFNEEQDKELMEIVVENVEKARDEQEIPQTSNANANKRKVPTTSRKREKPPPIVWHSQPPDIKAFRKFLEDLIEEEPYELKHGRGTTTIFVHQNTAWTKIIAKFKELKYDFHTYTNGTEKTHSFVLCGLDDTVTAAELQTEFNETYADFPLKKIFKMQKTWSPKFLIVTDNTVTINKLKNLRVLLNTRITWQRYQNNKVFIQCHRCQRWGHATSNCFSTPNCLKCAGPHLTTECKLKKEEQATCFHCQGSHAANSRDCEIYKKLLSNYEKRKPIVNKPRPQQPPPNFASETEFRPLPTPKLSLQNAWKTHDIETGVSDFVELRNEMTKLNGLINIKEFLQNLKLLNEKLVNCKSDIEKFTTAWNFFETMEMETTP